MQEPPASAVVEDAGVSDAGSADVIDPGATASVDDAGESGPKSPRPGDDTCQVCRWDCRIAAMDCREQSTALKRECEWDCQKLLEDDAISECSRQKCAPAGEKEDAACSDDEAACDDTCLAEHPESDCDPMVEILPGITHEDLEACCGCKKACSYQWTVCSKDELDREVACTTKCDDMKNKAKATKCWAKCLYKGHQELAGCYSAAYACKKGCGTFCLLPVCSVLAEHGTD